MERGQVDGAVEQGRFRVALDRVELPEDGWGRERKGASIPVSSVSFVSDGVGDCWA